MKELIVEFFFVGLIALEPGNADHGLAYLMDAHGQGLDGHTAELYACRDPDCKEWSRFSLQDRIFDFIWVPAKGSKELTHDFVAPRNDRPPEGSLKDGMPDTREDASDFLWTIDLRSLHKGSALRPCRTRRSRTPCGITSVMDLPYGELSSCQLVSHPYSNSTHSAGPVYIENELYGAATSIVRLEARVRQERVKGARLRTSKLAKWLRRKTGLLELPMPYSCEERSNRGNDCLTFIVSNQPAETQAMAQNNHFKAFNALLTRWSPLEKLVPRVAPHSKKGVQPSCAGRFEALWSNISGENHPNESDDSIRLFDAGSRPICPLVRL